MIDIPMKEDKSQKYNQIARAMRVLKALGFVQEPGWNIDRRFEDNEDMLFVESEFHRNRISVLVIDDEDRIHYEVYVMNDVGCGHVEIPYLWSELDESFLTHLKMSLCGHGFKTNE